MVSRDVNVVSLYDLETWCQTKAHPGIYHRFRTRFDWFPPEKSPKTQIYVWVWRPLMEEIKMNDLGNKVLIFREKKSQFYKNEVVIFDGEKVKMKWEYSCNFREERWNFMRIKLQYFEKKVKMSPEFILQIYCFNFYNSGSNTPSHKSDLWPLERVDFSSLSILRSDTLSLWRLGECHGNRVAWAVIDLSRREEDSVHLRRDRASSRLQVDDALGPISPRCSLAAFDPQRAGILTCAEAKS